MENLICLFQKKYLANTEKKFTETEDKNNKLEVLIKKKVENRDQLLLRNIQKNIFSIYLKIKCGWWSFDI